MSDPLKFNIVDLVSRVLLQFLRLLFIGSSCFLSFFLLAALKRSIDIGLHTAPTPNIGFSKVSKQLSKSPNIYIFVHTYRIHIVFAFISYGN